MNGKYNPIAGRSTRPLGHVYPDDSLVFPEGDYGGIGVNLDENDNSIIVDFARDFGTDDARGATIRFRRRSLTFFIRVLQGALECLEPGESDEFPDRDDDEATK